MKSSLATRQRILVKAKAVISSLDAKYAALPTATKPVKGDTLSSLFTKLAKVDPRIETSADLVAEMRKIKNSAKKQIEECKVELNAEAKFGIDLLNVAKYLREGGSLSISMEPNLRADAIHTRKSYQAGALDIDLNDLANRIETDAKRGLSELEQAEIALKRIEDATTVASLNNAHRKADEMASSEGSAFWQRYAKRLKTAHSRAKHHYEMRHINGTVKAEKSIEESIRRVK